MQSRFFGLPKAKEFLETSLRMGEKEAKKGKKHLNKFVQLRKEHIARIKTINEYLNKQMSKSLDAFPSFDSMNGFQNEMIATFIEVSELKRIIAHLNKMRKLIYSISRKYVSVVYKAQNERMVIYSYKQFLGRLFSFEKDLDKSILKLNKIIYELNKIPVVGDYPTIILAGFPNTGKTTILSRLTDSKPKIAAYAFTTQDLMLGYLEIKYNKI
ncbi:MAG: GTPase, partial [Nitrosarchaeum sp.]|nr:GTPase [Nitrosarchaeum sp.]